MVFVIPPDSRSVGSGNPPQDVNELSDMEGLLAAVLAQMAGYPGNSTVPGGNSANVTAVQTLLGGTYAGPGLAPVGNSSTGGDAANIQSALNLLPAGQTLLLQPGTYYLEQTVTIPAGNGLACLTATPSFGIPIADYGQAGLPVQGAILKPINGFANPNSATGVLLLTTASGQGGGQQLTGISMDCSSLPNGNDLHGVLIQDNTACVLLRDLNIYGGNGQLGGDCLHAVSSGGSPPDLLIIMLCHFSAAAGWGATMSGVADSYVIATEATANKTGNWNIINGNNTRYIGCKGETSANGPGWLFTAQSGFTGVVHVIGGTSQGNNADGWKFTGSGTGTYQLIACSDDGSGTNGGSGGGGYSGLNVTSFAGIVLATGWNSRVGTSPASPAYGVSMTSSNVLSLQGGGRVAGATASYNNGGGNTSFVGTQPPGTILAITQYAPGSLTTLSTSSSTYSAVSSANVNTGSFLIPPSGSVKVEASFVCSQATATAVVGFALAAHGTVSPLVGFSWQGTLANTTVNGITTIPFLITGQTPGASLNLDLLFATNGSSDTLSITAQGITSTSTSSTRAGPVLMAVQAV